MAGPRTTASKLMPPPEADPASRVTKHRRVFDHLLAGIQSGQLKPGDRLPSELNVEHENLSRRLAPREVAR